MHLPLIGLEQTSSYQITFFKHYKDFKNSNKNNMLDRTGFKADLEKSLDDGKIDIRLYFATNFLLFEQLFRGSQKDPVERP